MKVWKALFLLTGVVVIWLGARFGTGFYKYIRLSRVSPATIESWDVKEVKPSKYGIIATYFFEASRTERPQKYLFKPPYYPNIHAAEASIKRMKGLAWEAWYDPKEAGVSALQRYFPYKAAIHFGLAVGIFLYFIWLHEYAKNQAAILRKK